MRQLYKYDVHSLDNKPWLSTGTAITVEGVQMVRLGHGAIVSAEGFTEDLQQAMASAADRLELLMQPVQDRISLLRAGVKL